MLHPYKFGEQTRKVDVRVYKLDALYRKIGQPYKLSYMELHTGPNEFKPCVLFRPVGVDVSPGARYWVELHVYKRKKIIPFRYVVEFFDLAAKD